MLHDSGARHPPRAPRSLRAAQASLLKVASPKLHLTEIHPCLDKPWTVFEGHGQARLSDREVPLREGTPAFSVQLNGFRGEWRLRSTGGERDH